MKIKNLKLLALSFVLVLSCTKYDPDEFRYSGETFVAFENINSPSVSFIENGGLGRIMFSITAPQTVDTEVNFSIEELSVSVAYTIPSLTVVIPAGEVDGFFEILPIDDEDISPSTRLRLKIASVSPNLKIGMSEIGSYQKDIVLVNDDCPTSFNLWFGAVSAQDVGFGAVNAIGSGNDNGDCDIIRFTPPSTNFVAWSAGALSSVPHDFTLVPAFEGATFGTATLEPTVIGDNVNVNYGGAIGVVSSEILYTITSGFYNEATKVVEVNYQVRAKRKTDGGVASFGPNWAGTNRFIAP